MFFSNLRIRTKLLLPITLVSVLGSLTVAGLIGYKVQQFAYDNAKTIAKETAYHYANSIKGDFEVALGYANGLANQLEVTQVDTNLAVTRDQMNKILAHFIKSQLAYVGVSVMFEPNAFDGRDAQFVNQLGHDQTGRFVPYWTRSEKGEAVLEAMTNYDSEGREGEFYWLPKKTKKTCIIEPYTTTIQGKEVLVTSLMSPILNSKKEFIGVTEIDFSLTRLKEVISTIEITGLKGGYISVYSSTGTIVGTKNIEHASKNLKDVIPDREFFNKVMAGAPFFYELASATGGTDLVYGAPIEIGDTDTHWMVTVNIPKDELLISSYQLVKLIAWVSSVVLIITLLVVYLLSRAITKPLKLAVEIANTLAQGDLSVAIHVESQDEIGQLFNAMKNMVENITRVVLHVKEVAAVVSARSATLRQTSGKLSETADGQADATQQTASSTEEMSATIRQNSFNAQQTERLAFQVADNANRSGQAVADSLTAMRNIVSKISIIGEIASQINLLSLNASMEASRNQIDSRSFLVIAEAVAKLAERTKDASREINELSISSVDISSRANSLLGTLVPDIQRTATLIKEISAASNEQSSAALEISKAVVRLDQLTQQTSSNANQLASMSEELAMQSSTLQKAISYFRVSGEKTSRSFQLASMSEELAMKSNVALPHLED